MKLALLTTFAISLTAQEPRFQVRSRLVQLPVAVTDSESRAKDGLGAADFIVLDNGVARQATVDTIGRGVAPIALAVAVQGSGLSAAVIAKVQKIGGMIQLLITGESGCAALLSFSTRVNIRRVLLIIAESRDRFATYSQFKTAFTSDNRPLTARRSQTEAVPQVWETADNKSLKFQWEVQGRSVSPRRVNYRSSSSVYSAICPKVIARMSPTFPCQLLYH